MPLSLANLIENPDLIEQLRPPESSYPICPHCKKPIIHVHPDLLHEHSIDGVPFHEDCYWSAMSIGIEEHPPQNPRVRRG